MDALVVGSVIAAGLPLADWLIVAALAVVILLAIRYARTHPRVPRE